MKEIAIAIVVALVGFAAIAQATLKDNIWYTSVKLDWSQYHNIGFVPDNGPTRENQLDTGAFGGYQVNPYVGFETGYNWLGHIPCKGDNINGAYKVRGVQLIAKLSHPITGNLDVYTRLGGTVRRADTKANVPDGTSFKDYDTDVSPVFAGGTKYAVTPEIVTRLEYQWTSNIGDAHAIGTRPDNDMLSLGVSYRPGQDEVAPVAVPASAPAPEVQIKHFILKSDVLSTFNKTTLKPEGQAAPDQLYSQLSNLDPKDDSAVVLGYTNRIGSDAYSQALSECRTQSIVDYLISKGTLIDRISTRGMGESNPVTSNTYGSVKQCATLINCLTLDRRVEIEVKGIKGVIAQPQA